MNLEGVLEGLLFVQGDEGVTLESFVIFWKFQLKKLRSYY